MRPLLLVGALALGLTIGARTAGADVHVFVRHEVGDFAAWRKIYDGFQPTARKLGLTGQAVYQSVDNPNEVTIVTDFKTLAKAKAFAASPELKSEMEKAGVTGTPQIWYTTKASK
jgi:ABC-type sugar transport system substrate-binding protein